MDTSIKDEVYKDFKESMSKINFAKYNPTSPEFEIALFTGLMWMILNESSEGNEAFEKESEEPSDDIGEEIYGAKKYFQKYLDTRDENFKSLASDELRHAMFLIKRAYNKPIGNEERSKLKNYESDIAQVNEQIKSN